MNYPDLNNTLDLKYVQGLIDKNADVKNGKTASVSILSLQGKRLAFKKYRPGAIEDLHAMEKHLLYLFNNLGDKRYSEMMIYGSFPLYLVRDQGVFCGFVMNCIPEGCYDSEKRDRHLGCFYGVRDEIGDYSYQKIGSFVKHLAKAIDDLHEKGFVLGDILNDQNIFVCVYNGELLPYFVDTDSLCRGLNNPAQTYHSPNFEPPEGADSPATMASDVYKYCLIVLRMFSKPKKLLYRGGIVLRDEEATNSLQRIEATLGVDFKNFIVKGLCSNPQLRPSIRDVRKALLPKNVSSETIKNRSDDFSVEQIDQMLSREDFSSVFLNAPEKHSDYLAKNNARDIARKYATEAKNRIKERKKEGEVESVIKLIDSIGVVTYSEESNRRIRKARSAYRDLSIDQRTQVPTFKLSKAEAEYEELKNKAESKKKKYITSLAIAAALCIVGIVISLISISMSKDKSAVQSSIAITESNASALKTSYTISPAEEYLNKSISAFNAGLSQGKYKQVAFGGNANYCLKRDGTIEVFANDLELDKTLERAYSTWTDVESICIMYKYGKKDETVFGIRKDGTVIAPTGDMFAECDVSSWKNIVKLDASLGYLLAITSDGTVLSSINIKGWNGTQYKCNCKEIACFQTKDDRVIGVTKAGKIISIMPKSNSLMSTYQNKKWEDRISKWKNVKDIVVGKYDWNVYGLMKDGTVKYGGSFVEGFSANDSIDDKERDIAKWKNITAITEGYMHLVALDSKGNVYAIGDNEYGECNVSGWKNITRIEAFYRTSVGYDSDGRIYYTGRNCLDESLKKLHSETAVKESTETT